MHGKPVTQQRSAGEWVGGRAPLPGAEDDEAEDAADVIFWVEVATDAVVAMVAVGRSEPAEAALIVLEAAMREPAQGEPRRPAAVRVADDALAALLRRRLPGVAVCVAPTPELDAHLAKLRETLEQEDSD